MDISSLSSVSQASAQQSLQRLHAKPIIPSQSQLDAGGMPTSPVDPGTEIKVSQAMAGSNRGQLLNKVV